MISFVLSHDIIITSFYWDLLGLISYLPINFWSSKINCGIKAVLYNKIGDNFSLFLLILFYSFLSFISYYPELSYSIFLPFAIIWWLIFNSFYTTFNILILQLFPLSLFSILYSKLAQLPFSTWLLNYLIMNAILSIGSINYVRMIESCRIIHGLFYILYSKSAQFIYHYKFRCYIYYFIYIKNLYLLFLDYILFLFQHYLIYTIHYILPF